MPSKKPAKNNNPSKLPRPAAAANAATSPAQSIHPFRFIPVPEEILVEHPDFLEGF